jgi:hypothetical protein
MLLFVFNVLILFRTIKYMKRGFSLLVPKKFDVMLLDMDFKLKKSQRKYPSNNSPSQLLKQILDMSRKKDKNSFGSRFLVNNDTLHVHDHFSSLL